MTVEEIEKLKKSQKTLRIVGSVMIFIGYFVFLSVALQENTSSEPNPVIAVCFMFVAVAGIVMVLRSFFHVKYVTMKKAAQEREWLQEYERRQKWRQASSRDDEEDEEISVANNQSSTYLIYYYNGGKFESKLEVRDVGTQYEIIYKDDDALAGCEENSMLVPKDYFMNFTLVEIANMFNNMSQNKNLGFTLDNLQHNREFNRLVKGPLIIEFLQSINCLIKKRKYCD